MDIRTGGQRIEKKNTRVGGGGGGGGGEGEGDGEGDREGRWASRKYSGGEGRNTAAGPQRGDNSDSGGGGPPTPTSPPPSLPPLPSLPQPSRPVTTNHQHQLLLRERPAVVAVVPGATEVQSRAAGTRAAEERREAGAAGDGTGGCGRRDRWNDGPHRRSSNNNNNKERRRKGRGAAGPGETLDGIAGDRRKGTASVGDNGGVPNSVLVPAAPMTAVADGELNTTTTTTTAGAAAVILATAARQPGRTVPGGRRATLAKQDDDDDDDDDDGSEEEEDCTLNDSASFNAPPPAVHSPQPLSAAGGMFGGRGHARGGHRHRGGSAQQHPYSLPHIREERKRNGSCDTLGDGRGGAGPGRSRPQGGRRGGG
ncbi:protein SPT2 homolog [Anopheles cruzii]|uniref:protein SPT2 homolog n=1 Tax=Anopheles cruzii TaxID=68878 RepID=UPI0022EC6E64|nr:protein SPT2 homolog [Anopheles cruzii]